NATNNIAALNLNGFTQTVGQLTMGAGTGSGVVLNTGATGVLKLTGDLVLSNNRDSNDGTTSARTVLITGSGSFGTPTFDGMLDLAGGMRNITVTSSASLANQGPINGAGIPGGGGTLSNNDHADALIETVISNGG